MKNSRINIPSSFLVALLLALPLVGLPPASAAEPAQNLVANPGFESRPRHTPRSEAPASRFVEKGWDLGDGGQALFVPEWTYNEATAPAAVRLVENAADQAVHSGKQCLLVNGRGAQIYTAPGKGRADPSLAYTVSVYAKGAGKLEVMVYEYDTQDGKPHYLRVTRILREAVTDEWQKYEGAIQIANPDTETFNLALGVEGEIWIDDVSLTEKGP